MELTNNIIKKFYTGNYDQAKGALTIVNNLELANKIALESQGS